MSNSMVRAARTTESTPEIVSKVTAIQPSTLRTISDWLKKKPWKVATSATVSFLGVAGVILTTMVVWADGATKVVDGVKSVLEAQGIIDDAEGKLKADQETEKYNAIVSPFIFKLDERLLNAGASVPSIVALDGDTPTQRLAIASRQAETARIVSAEHEQREHAEKLINALDTLAGCMKSECNRAQLIENAGYSFCANDRTFRSWIVQTRKTNPSFGREFTDFVDTLDCRPFLYPQKASV